MSAFSDGISHSAVLGSRSLGGFERMKTFEHRFSWLRLIAAIFVAFIASLAWLGLYSEYFGFVGPYLGNVLLGFFGVLAGSFCFHRRHRFLGSLILFVGGVALDLFFEGADDKVYPLSVVWVVLVVCCR